MLMDGAEIDPGKSAGGDMRLDDDRSGLSAGAKARFADRLWTLMKKKGWNGSEVARRAGIGRDSVSSYIRKKQFPEPLNQEKIAQAFGMEVDELMQDVFGAAPDGAAPAMAMREVKPGRAFLVVNKEVPLGLAAKILALLSDEELDRS